MKMIFICALLILSSCSQKQQSKSSFKILLGKTVTATLSGGAYVNTIDKAIAKNNIIKLDTDNSALIPYGTFDLLFVTFDGPEVNTGIMRCGSVLGRTFSVSTDTVTVTISENECANPLYSSTILELKKGTTAKWNYDRFDLSNWGN